MLKRKILIQSIINYITKNGRKNFAKHLFLLALAKASKRTKVGCHSLIVKIFRKLRVFVEVKQVIRRKKVSNIPFPITLKRQRYLSIKWFFNAVKENKGPQSFSDKIYLELVALSQPKKKSKAIKFKEQNVALAVANRSNIHFR